MRTTLGLLLAFFAASLSAQDSVRIRCSVVDETGQPLAGIGLAVASRWQTDIGELLATPLARSDKNGRIRAFAQVSDQSSVLIGAPGRACVWRFLFYENFWKGDIELGHFILPVGKKIRGLVRDAEGKPLAGVRIDALDALRANQLGVSGLGPIYVASARSDAKGRFVLSGIVERGAAVTVRAAGYYLEHIPYASSREPLVVQLKRGGEVSGRVVDTKGQPVLAWLMLRYEHSEEAIQRTTQPDGTYHLNLDYPGRYRVYAMERCPERPSYWSASPILEEEPKSGVTLSIDRRVKGQLSLSVVDSETGEKVKDIFAAGLWGNPVKYSDPKPVAMVRSSQPGQVVLMGPVEEDPTYGAVLVRAKGYAMHVATQVQFDEEDTSANAMSVKLVRESSIAGTVIDEKTGDPVADARVVAWHKDRKVAHFYSTLASPRYVVTDEKGRFCISQLGAGDWVIHMLHPDRPDSLGHPITLEAHQARTGVTVKMPRGFPLRGQITGMDKLPSGLISALCSRGRLVRPYISTQSSRPVVGADGKFLTSNLRPGQYKLGIQIPQPTLTGCGTYLSLGDAQVGETDEIMKISFTDHRPGRVQGKVKVSGATIPHNRLLVAKEAGRRRAVAVALVGRDGSFEFFSAKQVSGLMTIENEFNLCLLDLATGALLYRSEDQIMLKPGETVQHDISLQLALVRLELKSERSSTLVASRLNIAVHHPGWKEPRAPSAFLRTRGYPSPSLPHGLALRPDQKEVVLYLPQFETRIQVFRGKLEKLERPYLANRSPVGHVVFVPEIGKTNRVSIEVEAPEDGQ